MNHILLPCGVYGAALDIFSHAMFMVYLKFAGQRFDIITKNTEISVAGFFVPLYYNWQCLIDL